MNRLSLTVTNTKTQKLDQKTKTINNENEKT